MTSRNSHDDDEETNLKEALLNKPNNNDNDGSTTLAPGHQLEVIDDFRHWGPCKKGLLLLIIMFVNGVSLWRLSWRLFGAFGITMEPPNQVLPLQEGQQQQQQQQQFLRLDPTEQAEQFPMDFEIVSMEDILAANNLVTTNNVSVSIPQPIHPHHTASVTYSSRMSPEGGVEYRRDINAPCEFGMLIFSVGPAKDELPYTYELYNDAYLYSDNNGLCIFYPSYNGYQTSSVPLWNPTDPLQVILKPLDKSIMHWISSRVYDPYHSKKTWDRTKVGDYAIIAKYNFYDPGFYKGLKAEINSWK